MLGCKLLMAAAIALRPFTAVFAAAKEVNLIFGWGDSYRRETGGFVAAIAKGLAGAVPAATPPQILPFFDGCGKG